MSKPTLTAPSGVVLDWRRAATGQPEPCVLCGGLTVCRSPVKGTPCHKACAEEWITTHTTSPAERARLVAAYTPRKAVA